MRTITFLAAGVTALMGLALAPAGAAASEYPWCARYGDDHGGTNCGFSTLAQCEAALSGNAGICDRNLFYPDPPAPAAKSRDKSRTPSPKRG